MAWSIDLLENVGLENSSVGVDDTISSFSGWMVTKYIPIVGGARYKLYTSHSILGNGASTNYYDVDKNLLKGFSTNTGGRVTTTAPENAVFVRVTVSLGNSTASLVQETMTDIYPTDPDAPPVVNEVKYEVTQNDIDLFDAKQVTLKSNNVEMFAADLIGKGSKLTLHVKRGYLIMSASVEYQSFVTGDFNVSSNNKIASFTLPSDVGNITLGNWEIDTKEVTAEPPAFQGYTFTQSDKTKIETAKGQLFINDKKAVVGSTFASGDLVEIRPIDGFKITEVLFNSSGGTKTFAIDGIKATSNFLNWDADWMDDPNGLGQPIQNSQLKGGSFQSIEYESVVVIPPDVNPTQGVNNVYLVDDENMKSLSTKNFEVYFGSPDNPDIVNYSKYIAGLINLPFTVDTDLIKEVGRDIKLKNRSFNVEGDLLFTDVIRYDLGVIKVLPNENNFLDYDGVVCFLHLPYCDSFSIDVDYVIGYDIGISYDVNLYDGIANINITSSKIGGVVVSKRVNLGITVPFGTLVDIPNNNDPRNVDLGGANDVKTPYIEILKNDAVLPYGFFTTPISDESLLLNQIGFVKIDEIDLKVKTSRDEKEMILNAMNGGVIIK